MYKYAIIHLFKTNIHLSVRPLTRPPSIHSSIHQSTHPEYNISVYTILWLADDTSIDEVDQPTFRIAVIGGFVILVTAIILNTICLIKLSR